MLLGKTAGSENTLTEYQTKSTCKSSRPAQFKTTLVKDQLYITSIPI